MIENFGTIIDFQKINNYVFIVTNDNEIYSLIKHDLRHDITSVVVRVSDLSYVEEVIKNERRNNQRNY